MHPFANEKDIIRVDNLTIENHTDFINIFGNLTITRDQQGLVYAEKIVPVMQDVLLQLKRLHQQAGLPEKLPDNPVRTLTNPFKL